MHSASLAEEFSSFAPEFIKRRLAGDPKAPQQSIAERWPGAALVADISGFTALTERLAELGSVGAERLTEILDKYFGHAVARIELHGGDVARFAGDGLLVVWPCNTENEVPAAVRCAAACAMDLITPPGEESVESESPLTMKVAVGAGSLAALHVGGFLDRWEFLISGGAFQQAFAALRQTQAATCTASLQAWKHLQQDYRATTLAGGVMLLEEGPSAPQGPPLVSTAARDEMTGALRSYIPAAVIDRLSAGHGSWMGELRVVTVLFVSLPELSYTTPLDRAQTVMHYLQRELYRFEGAVNKLNVDEKGAALLAAFGLPPLAHEDDARRGVAAALAMQRRLRDLGFDVSIGVATGRVFCGVFGGARRREYTLLGDTVNRAARLMQTAVGDILCDDATRRAAERLFQFESLPSVMLKGKAAPLAVHRPIAQVRSLASHAEFVGREAELSRLQQAFDAAVESRQARFVLLEGEPGAGKSRLLTEWLQRAERQGAGCYFGQGDALEAGSLYFAWRPIFERLFSVDAAKATGEIPPQLVARLRDFPDRADWAPLLGAVLPIDAPDNELTAQMTGRVRGENTRRLLAELLQSEAAPRPLAIVLDDVQWLDSASWELIEQLSHAAGPIFLVLGARPMAETLPWPLARMLEAPHASRITLGPLSPEGASQLACKRLGVTSLPRRVADFIHRRTEGNPLFTEELAFTLRDTGVLDISEGKCMVSAEADLDRLEIPDTLHGVITARLDRLAPPQLLTVKVASVIGRHFPYATLLAIYPVEPDRPHLREHLGAALQSQIIEVEVPEPELAYLFRHVLARDAAYHLLLFHQREQLHRAVAEWREKVETQVPPQACAALAYHWRHAGEPARAVDYLERAGQHALASGAYQEAIASYREALELNATARLENAAPRVASWERRLGEAYLGLGRLADSREHLQTALILRRRPEPASILRLGAGLLGHLVAQLRPARKSLAQDRREAFLEIARAYEALAEIHYLCNQKAPLVHALVANLDFAKRAGPSPELARAYANNCFSAGFGGLHGLARRYARRALEIGRAVNDDAALAWVLEVTGLYSLGVGQADRVEGDLTEAIAICRRLGDWRRWGENMATRAQGLLYCGRLEEGYRAWSELRQAAAARGDELQQAWGLNGSAEGLLRLHAADAADEAAALLHEANELYERNVDRISQLGAWGLLAWAQTLRGDAGAATAALRAGLQLAEEVGAPTGHYPLSGYANLVRAGLWLCEHGPAGGARDHARLTHEAQRQLSRYARTFPIGRPAKLLWQGTVDWISGRTDRALRNWRRAIAAAQSLHMPYEEALAHQEFAKRLPSDDPKHGDHAHAADSLWKSLGGKGAQLL